MQTIQPVLSEVNMMKRYSLIERYGMLRSRFSIILEDAKTATDIALGKRLNLLRKGFYSWHDTLYNLEHNDINDYLSEYERRKTRFINGQASYILSNKLVCDQILRQYVRTATIYSIIWHGNICCVDTERTITDCESIIKYMNESGPLILKPNSGADGGRGVMLICIQNGRILCNESQIDPDDLEKLIESLDEYIVCEFIRQGEYGNYLFVETVNSIRILTMLCPQEHKPFVAASIQRIGTCASKPVDNWSAGGLSAYIDADTGVLSRAASFRNGVMNYYDVHPDTGMPIEGVSVPDWHRITKDVLGLASKVPYLPYVAWDVVPLDDEILIVEANNCSDVSMLQVHEPLLRNEKAREFYRHYHIIK
jgi:hypothetical protein